MIKRNKELDDYFKLRKVPKWRVAERMGMADSSFSRMLRYEISEVKQGEIRKHIDAVADELTAE